MSQELEPEQVMELLHALYLRYDSLLKARPYVYKVRHGARRRTQRA
mgnify:CR=1 FL=1